MPHAGKRLDPADLDLLVQSARQRGRDSSGLLYKRDLSDMASADRADFDISRLITKSDLSDIEFLFGHSRLITNSQDDNQPVVRGDIAVLHNGIVVNDTELWTHCSRSRELDIDTEVIVALCEEFFDRCQDTANLQGLADFVLQKCDGVVAVAIVLGRIGKLVLFSNNGSLYSGSNQNGAYFSSESFPLRQIGCKEVVQIRGEAQVIDISRFRSTTIKDYPSKRVSLVPSLGQLAPEEALLEYPAYELVRCSRCILPETMPFIRFDSNGICNYCNSYTPRNNPKPRQELMDQLEPYRRKTGAECIVPFSGGRDSCFGLHLIVNELGLRPITYTYDWGMVTDLGRRNISRMSARLGVENIIVAADIELKRRNINKNLTAWLKSPHLGMVSILTAGDKHFFRYVETIKRQTGVSLNLWGINPLEITHFKSGFLGVPPDFEEDRVYSHGAWKQLRYQWLRLNAMTKSLGYFNSSLWDTLSGEYYRSFTQKTDYLHIFDYWRWDEAEIDSTLELYDWEKAPDTSTTWRIGDGTAALYNYIYYTVAGFTEHDTFRSNQIREGDLTRAQALELVLDENRPRYPNIKWYLDAVGMDFSDTISAINSIPRLV